MQTITELDQWREPLEQMRAWVLSGVAQQDADFQTRWRRDWATKVGVVAAYLVPGELRPDETWKLQALGVVLGDAMVLRTGARWVEINDDGGADPCLRLNTTATKVVFPMTMIAKRVEKGETLDVQDLIALVDSVAKSSVEPVPSPAQGAVAEQRAVASASGVAVDAHRAPSPAVDEGMGRKLARLVHRLRS
ncbi:DUF3806 domain-containing protein [Auraticoccus monumenti]|uniref:DUF3806 domain-containing protein n=1 Tax=Auraticoccus monumenti TaxID=675864 RepID=A0A1G6TEL3_9ACTN|nr:DUF3806 domain-containing protein [Auraticoccus monumenti]SDD27518.1 protein of unknown function [Auraticoccus monumenti]